MIYPQLVFAALPMHAIYAAINKFIAGYGYAAVVALMALESASVPMPSEVILPLTGRFAAESLLNPYLAVLATMIGTAIGITVDYAVAYMLGKELVYRHLKSLRIRRSSLESFDAWFAKNGPFAVFVSRLLPLVRGLISFPAGFARMDLKRFYLYSMAGALVWNVALIAFGYYALSTSSLQVLFLAVAAFIIALYAAYRIALIGIGKG